MKNFLAAVILLSGFTLHINAGMSYDRINDQYRIFADDFTALDDAHPKPNYVVPKFAKYDTGMGYIPKNKAKLILEAMQYQYIPKQVRLQMCKEGYVQCKASDFTNPYSDQ